MTYAEAADGLPAREVHAWSAEKLFYTERYMDIFTTGMKNHWDNLVYADFFAGPGRCVDEESGEESEGSPLRALRYGFSRIFLNDHDHVAVDALRKRTRGEDRVHISQLDCNDAVDEAIDFLILPGERSLGLAFIDPTAHQMRFESIRKLTERGRFDLLVTFMTNFPKRFITTPGYGPNSDFAGFMGNEAYNQNLHGRPTVETHRLLEIYSEQLGSIGYEYVDHVARIVNTRGSTIYHQVFASRSQRGKEFFEKIRQRTYTGQQRMELS